jgi:excisionase family DNA binding protein
MNPENQRGTEGKSQQAPAYITQQQAAALLQVTPRTIRKMTRAGIFAVYRCGRVVRYRREDLESAMSRTLRVGAIGES